MTKYEGALKFDPISAFLNQYAAPEPATSARAGEAGEGGGAGGEEEGREKSPAELRALWAAKLTGAEVAAKVEASEEMWLVAFLGDAGGAEVAGKLLLGVWMEWVCGRVTVL